MTNDIKELIGKYEKLIERIENNLKTFPEHALVLSTRRNVYMDMILDLNNILALHKEDNNEKV